ncbi:MAG: GNAT family N-acetyltransferase [Bacteroidales bacterium]|nr:GNAT family N-acetyltransferase [Bacteroidales bacterium]
MNIIPADRVKLYRALLIKEGKTYFPLINAVLQGFQKGKVFADNIEDPKIIFFLTNSGFSQYFLLKNAHLKKSFINFIYESVDIPFYFHIYDPHESLSEMLEEKGLGIKQRERQQLQYLSKNPIELNVLPEGFKLYDCSQLDFNELEVFKLDLGNRYWSSPSDFTTNGYGKCIVNQAGDPVSVCYSACIADGVSEVDIATLPGYQGKGLGKIVTQAFINESIMRGLVVNWDCFTENMASLRTAESSGFCPVKTYRLLSVFNKRKKVLSE